MALWFFDSNRYERILLEEVNPNGRIMDLNTTLRNIFAIPTSRHILLFTHDGVQINDDWPVQRLANTKETSILVNPPYGNTDILQSFLKWNIND